MQVSNTCQIVHESDGVLGSVSVTERSAGLICGQFSAHSAFERYRALFVEFESVANDVTLSLVDAVGRKIEALGLIVVTAQGQRIKIHDVQIWSDGKCSFRVPG